MILDITLKLKCSDTLFSLRGERKEMYFAIRRIANEIEEMSFKAGMLSWEWSIWTGGWTQVKDWTYKRNKGIVRQQERRIFHGNGPECGHPWKFAMKEPLATNPMYDVDPVETLLPF